MAKLNVDQLKKANLKVGNKFKLNNWLVFDGIAAIIIVGVLAARLTHAGVDYTFNRTPQQMSSGTMGRTITGSDYRHLAANGIHAETSATVSAADIAASHQVCAQFHVRSSNTFVDVQINGHYANKFVASAGEATVCADVNNQNQGGEVYAGTSGDADVYSIYGTR